MQYACSNFEQKIYRKPKNSEKIILNILDFFYFYQGCHNFMQLRATQTNLKSFDFFENTVLRLIEKFSLVFM